MSMPGTGVAGDRTAELIADPARAAELRALITSTPSWDLTPRQLCDLELLLNGGMAPLRSFMGSADHETVCTDMRLRDGSLWPIPVVLDVTEEFAASAPVGTPVALRDPEGVALAVLTVEEAYSPDREREARLVYGTDSREHPGVAALLDRTNPVYLGGRLEGLELPVHHDFRDLRRSPAQVRAEFARRGWTRVVAFQTRNPMHRAHQELTLRAAESVDAHLLIHPVVGMTKPGDVDHYTRVRCYQALLPTYPMGMAMLSLLPAAMRMAGPREVLMHAIMRRNFGCTHLIVGRDHAGPGQDSSGRPFYGPYEAQDSLRRHQAEIGIEMVPFPMMVYVPDLGEYRPENDVPEGMTSATISGTQLRRKLALGEEIPEWFTFPAVAAELRRRHPARVDQGVTVFFTGLSGAGKSTIANALVVKLLERGDRSVTLLDGDLVRKHLSSELGFSREHRDINIKRIGYVASEITKHGGVAVCAPIAPYDATRREVRAMVEAGGGFVLVHVSTPIDECERRDRKGLYAKARAGVLKEFTGVSDPYEEPADAEITLDTTGRTPEAEAMVIVHFLEREGYLPPRPAH